MLKQLRSRKMVKGIMLWTLVLVIPSFVFFYGWQSSSNERAHERQSLVFVKDRWGGLRWRPIGENEQVQAQRELLNEYGSILQRISDKITHDDLRNMIGTRELANEVLNNFYLEQLARKKGLEVTEGELNAMLTREFAGQTRDSVRRYLQQIGMSEDEYAHSLAFQITLAKARSFVMSRAKASLFELWQEYLIGQEKIQMQYVRIPTQDFESKIKPTSQTLQAYYDAHKESYRVGDRATFRYVALFRSDIEKTVQATTDSVKAHYEKNKEKLFARPRSAAISHILLKLAPDAATTAVLAAEQKIKDLAQKARAGANFAQLADQSSEDPINVLDPKDPAKKRGGKLLAPVQEDRPCIPYGDEFKRVALTLKRDELSSPLRTAMGWELLKADQVTTGGIRSFDEVREEATALVREELANQEFQKRGKELKELMTGKTYSTLESFAEAAKLPVQDTGEVDLDSGYLPKVGSIRQDLDVIKELREGEFTQGVLKSADAFYVLELVKKQPAHVPAFETVYPAVREDYVTSEAAHLAHLEARAILSQAKTFEAFKKLTTDKALKLTETEPFTRETVDRILPNLDPNFRRLTLGYKEGTLHLTTQGDPKLPTAYIVWYYAKRERPSLEQFRKDLPTIRAEYLMELQQALLEEWFHDQRRQLPGKINPSLEQREEADAGELPPEGTEPM